MIKSCNACGCAVNLKSVKGVNGRYYLCKDDAMCDKRVRDYMSRVRSKRLPQSERFKRLVAEQVAI